MTTSSRPSRFVPVLGQQQVGRLVFAGREESARIGQGVSGDGLWRECDRRDGGVLFLLIDIEDKGPKTLPLREILELALDDEATSNLLPSELLVELHSQAVVSWAETGGRYFHAQAVLVRPEDDHFLLASAAIPNPYRASGAIWEEIEAPTESVCMLGIPDLHDDSGPVFPDSRFSLSSGDAYVACTDGITDLGKRGGLRPSDVVAMLNALASIPEPEELLRRVFDLAAKHEGADWPGDDSTAVAFVIAG